MIRRKLYSLIAIAVFVCGLLSAQTEESSTLTLEQCVSLAVQHNPLVLSALQQYQASLARVRQAKALPQPSLDYDSDLQPNFFDFKEQAETYLGGSWSLEFPGKRSLRGKIATKESDELMQEIELLKLDIVFQVKQAFYSLLLAQEKLKYAEQDLELAQDFLSKAEVKFSAGDVAKVEALRARVEAAKAANEVRVAGNEVRLARAMLNFLLARKKYAPMEIKGELKKATISLDLEYLIQRALAFRPEIRRINLSLQRESFQKKQGYLSYLPDFDIGVAQHWIEGEGKTWDVTLSFPIPLFFWQPKKGEIAEAQANIEALKNETEHLKNAITFEVEEAYMNALTAQNQIQLFEEEMLTQAEEVYNMYLFSFQEGEIGGIELIEARRTLLETRKSYADALFNYDAALAALEKSVGSQSLEGEKQ
ncbi:MAG: TolC family protein [Candidatus Aminicenantes bacterium]|nr:TolC family protein [Candidatus Aminicenantes bacterium]MDH5466812.1 TolC family protein [Candidatus Aminicenantes bacterium]MDH5706409.1 TolC family protein [Candidatus Aminicenantes bacterium]